MAGQGLGRSWSFAQLQDAANRLSRVLDAQGVRPGERVAIVLPQRFTSSSRSLEDSSGSMAIVVVGRVLFPEISSKPNPIPPAAWPQIQIPASPGRHEAVPAP